MQELSKINDSDNEQLVIYDSNINAQIIGLHKKDYDLFMTCAYKLKDMSNQTIEVGYRELMNTGHFERLSLQDFHHYLNDETKIDDIKLEVIEEDGEEVNKRRIPLFKDFHPKWRNRKLELTVNDVFVNYFSQLTGYFTELDLVIYTSLKSKYSKILYQNLCQFRGKNGKGWWDIPLEDNVRDSQPIGFKTLFEVPKSYKNKEILKEIIKPSVMELAPYMAIEVNSIYGTGRGKPVIGYHFDFKPSKTKAIEEKKPKIRELTDKEKEEYNELVANAEQIELFNSLSSKIKAITDLDDLSVKMIVDTAESQNKGDDEVVSICHYAVQQNTNNLAAYIITLIAKGFSVPKKTVKKNSFNNFEGRKYDYDELERQLLANNGIG